MAYHREWPEPEFIKEVEEAFPEQGIANVEEARVSELAVALLTAYVTCSALVGHSSLGVGAAQLCTATDQMPHHCSEVPVYHSVSLQLA